MKISAPPFKSALLSAELLAAQWQTWIASIGDALRGDNSRVEKTSGGCRLVLRSVGGIVHVTVQIPKGTDCGGVSFLLPCSVESGALLMTSGTTVIGCLVVAGDTLSLPGQTWADDGFITGTLAQKES